MTTMERKETLQSLYNQARLAGICHSQKEFAELLGINKVSMSMAMNGDQRYLTDSLFSKIDKLFADHNIQTVTDNHGTVINQQKNFQTASATEPTSAQERIDKFLDLLKEKDAQMNRLLTIIEKLTIK